MTTLEDRDAPAAHSVAVCDFRTLMVHVEATAAASARLHVAVDLARRLDATLVGVGAQMVQSLGIADPMGALSADWSMQLEGMVQEDLRRAEATFRAKTAGLRTEWLALEAIPGAILPRLARGADLVIAGGAPTELTDTYKTADTAELVMRAGRPILVAPPQGGRLHGRAVVVGWKDTREARRAVADSLPFLKLAEDVLVVEVCPADDIASGEIHTFEVAQYLRRHGVHARSKAVAETTTLTATQLNIEAGAIGADLIVCGAYGHTRLGEWLFGGVTYDLLRDPECFLLLSH